MSFSGVVVRNSTVYCGTGGSVGKELADRNNIIVTTLSANDRDVVIEQLAR